jgi:DNA-directed RNA polymerase specialized sigma24 family protein
METGSYQCECDKRLTDLFNQHHNWLIKSANKITRHKQESECLVQELYQYLHEKCNPNLFGITTPYNLFYCSKFLHSRFINKTKKLNRTILVEDINNDNEDIPYDEDWDLLLQKTHEEVLNELKKLSTTRMWPAAKIFELYWMSEDTLDQTAKKIGISKSTCFLAVKKCRKYLEQVIENPFDESSKKI